MKKERRRCNQQTHNLDAVLLRISQAKGWRSRKYVSTNSMTSYHLDRCKNMGTAIDHSDPDQQDIYLNSSIGVITDQTSWKGPEIHGEK